MGATSPVNTAPTPKVENSQSLLEEIFGSSGASQSATNPQPSAPQKSSVNDILGLFDSPAAPAVAAPSTSSLFTSVSSPPPQQVQPTPPPAAPAAPELQSYTVYDKNELKITLTPQVNAQHPGMVQVMARFQVTGGSEASGINFQAAVPKVLILHSSFSQKELTCIADPTTENVSNVKFNGGTWHNGNANVENYCTTRCKLSSTC